jgi:hypothetical protein
MILKKFIKMPIVTRQMSGAMLVKTAVSHFPPAGNALHVLSHKMGGMASLPRRHAAHCENTIQKKRGAVSPVSAPRQYPVSRCHAHGFLPAAVRP